MAITLRNSHAIRFVRSRFFSLQIERNSFLSLSFINATADIAGPATDNLASKSASCFSLSLNYLGIII